MIVQVPVPELNLGDAADPGSLAWALLFIIDRRRKCRCRGIL
jgi:hypothetical protein